MGCHLWGHKELDTTEQLSLTHSRLIYNVSSVQQNNSVIRIYREKAMAPHSSTLAWKIPWMEEPGRLQSMGLLRVGHV